MPHDKLPFIFARMKEQINITLEDNVECWVVIISEPVWNRALRATNGPVNYLVTPENTIEDKLEEKTFPTYQDAWKCVQDWWINQPKD